MLMYQTPCLVLRIWSDPQKKKKKKCLCPPGTYILENMQISTHCIESGKGYEEEPS